MCPLRFLIFVPSELQTCVECGERLDRCPVCQEPISNRIRLFLGDPAKRIFFNECVEKRIKMKLDYTWSGVLSKIVYGFVFLACCSINVNCSVPILEDIFL